MSAMAQFLGGEGPSWGAVSKECENGELMLRITNGLRPVLELGVPQTQVAPLGAGGKRGFKMVALPLHMLSSVAVVTWPSFCLVHLLLGWDLLRPCVQQ